MQVFHCFGLIAIDSPFHHHQCNVPNHTFYTLFLCLQETSLSSSHPTDDTGSDSGSAHSRRSPALTPTSSAISPAPSGGGYPQQPPQGGQPVAPPQQPPQRPVPSPAGSTGSRCNTPGSVSGQNLFPGPLPSVKDHGWIKLISSVI